MTGGGGEAQLVRVVVDGDVAGRMAEWRIPAACAATDGNGDGGRCAGTWTMSSWR